MKLSKKDADLFFSLYLPLLYFVGTVYNIENVEEFLSTKHVPDYKLLLQCADELYNDVSIIDEFIEIHEELTDEHIEILNGWKHFTRGRFVLERHLKAGSIFIHWDTREVFQVSGITDSLEDVFSHLKLPIIVLSTIIPFKGRLIADGLFIDLPVKLSKQDKDLAKRIYMYAKNNGEVIKKL